MAVDIARSRCSSVNLLASARISRAILAPGVSLGFLVAIFFGEYVLNNAIYKGQVKLINVSRFADGAIGFAHEQLVRLGAAFRGLCGADGDSGQGRRGGT